jgi:hypothetical protein
VPSWDDARETDKGKSRTGSSWQGETRLDLGRWRRMCSADMFNVDFGMILSKGCGGGGPMD